VYVCVCVCACVRVCVVCIAHIGGRIQGEIKLPLPLGYRHVACRCVVMPVRCGTREKNDPRELI
jgi:hypothetical protein